jgi:hypothetical protein
MIAYRRLAIVAAALFLVVPPCLSTRAQARDAGVPFDANNDGRVSVEDLLFQMLDLRWLAVPPVEGERTVQFSSYDRKSKLVDGKIVDTFANGDRGEYLRVDRKNDGTQEFVLAEADGPGFVSRIWSANPDGDIRIYVDGSDTPVLTAGFAKLTNGEVAPFGPPLGHEASRGHNLYFPFPFAKSIRIVTTKGDQYYQVGVTYLPKGTKVESYSTTVLDRVRPLIEGLQAALVNGPKPLLDNLASEPGAAVEVKDGASAVLLERSGENTPQAISALQLKVTAEDRDAALARSTLSITFDGAKGPQVSVPVGDFFGSGPGVNPFQTVATRVEADGTMTSRWPMPFRSSCKVELRNESGQPISVTSKVLMTPSLPDADLMHFHARWKQKDDIQTKAGDGTEDWRALAVSGAPGRFVGLSVNIFNPTPAWWGEGDEKIFVDGETFPSTFGTGTEDYFGYAWCDPHPYVNPYHAQTRCDGPGNHGNTSNVRFQVLDAVPWRSGLDFDIEIWHWKAVKVQYASLAYFYAAEGATIAPPPVTDLSKRVIHSGTMEVRREPGVIEGEDLRLIQLEGGARPDQDMLGWGEEWSGAKQLWWTQGKAGDRMRVTLPVAEAGEYAIVAGFTKAPDYGVVAIEVDGKAIGKPIDLYGPQVVHSGPIELGRATLAKGDHLMSLSITGKNARSKAFLVGLDWIKLVPVK